MATDKPTVKPLTRKQVEQERDQLRNSLLVSTRLTNDLHQENLRLKAQISELTLMLESQQPPPPVKEPAPKPAPKARKRVTTAKKA